MTGNGSRLLDSGSLEIITFFKAINKQSPAVRLQLKFPIQGPNCLNRFITWHLINPNLLPTLGLRDAGYLRGRGKQSHPLLKAPA